jgi:hypothetical protein
VEDFVGLREQVRGRFLLRHNQGGQEEQPADSDQQPEESQSPPRKWL